VAEGGTEEESIAQELALLSFAFRRTMRFFFNKLDKKMVD